MLAEIYALIVELKDTTRKKREKRKIVGVWVINNVNQSEISDKLGFYLSLYSSAVLIDVD